MYILYADYGREGEESICISTSKETLENIIPDVRFYYTRWLENEDYKSLIPDFFVDIIGRGIRSEDLKIKEIKEV